MADVTSNTVGELVVLLIALIVKDIADVLVARFTTPKMGSPTS